MNCKAKDSRKERKTMAASRWHCWRLQAIAASSRARALYLHVESAVLDGEIACVDDTGRPVFRDLLFRRRHCVFIAFDLLYLNAKDLRILPLIERKAPLKKLLKRVHEFSILITSKVTALRLGSPCHPQLVSARCIAPTDAISFNP